MYVHFVAGKEKTKPLDKASSSEKCHVKGCITRPPIIIFRNNRNEIVATVIHQQLTMFCISSQGSLILFLIVLKVIMMITLLFSKEKSHTHTTNQIQKVFKYVTLMIDKKKSSKQNCTWHYLNNMNFWICFRCFRLNFKEENVCVSGSWKCELHRLFQLIICSLCYIFGIMGVCAVYT